MANVIDVHVHFGTPENPETGCYWSNRFEHTAAYYLMRIVLNSIFRKPTPEYVKKVLLKAVNTSKLVDKTVLLALDEVYDPNGVRRKEWTHLHVPNEYLVQLAQQNDRILFGASVHPYRQDWEEQLDFCLQHGAVLCKWIPSSQQIDPSNPQCDHFYRKLVQHNLPLLCHAGPEYTIPTSCEQYDEFNNPKYVERALDMGVTVILAHCALPYFGDLDKKYLREDIMIGVSDAYGNKSGLQIIQTN